jgi:PIN domain nuclease of toxin-antitoxin system
MSLVILAEIVGYFAKLGVGRSGIREFLDDFAAERVPLDEEQSLQVGPSEPLTRALCLLLVDRACLALARSKGVPALTGGRQWIKAAPLFGVEVELVR